MSKFIPVEIDQIRSLVRMFLRAGRGGELLVRERGRCLEFLYAAPEMGVYGRASIGRTTDEPVGKFAPVSPYVLRSALRGQSGRVYAMLSARELMIGDGRRVPVQGRLHWEGVPDEPRPSQGHPRLLTRDLPAQLQHVLRALNPRAARPEMRCAYVHSDGSRVRISATDGASVHSVALDGDLWGVCWQVPAAALRAVRAAAQYEGPDSAVRVAWGWMWHVHSADAEPARWAMWGPGSTADPALTRALHHTESPHWIVRPHLRAQDTMREVNTRALRAFALGAAEMESPTSELRTEQVAGSERLSARAISAGGALGSVLLCARPGDTAAPATHPMAATVHTVRLLRALRGCTSPTVRVYTGSPLEPVRVVSGHAGGAFAEAIILPGGD